MPLPRWSQALTALLLLHVAWGLARLPGKVLGRRLADIGDYRHEGAAAFHFTNNHLDGAEIVDWLRANTDEDAAVLWRGTETNAVEFAASLLWPRLLVRADTTGGATTVAGRTIAVGTHAGSSGQFVLVAANAELTLEVR